MDVPEEQQNNLSIIYQVQEYRFIYHSIQIVLALIFYNST